MELIGHRRTSFCKSCPNFLRSTKVIIMTLSYEVILVLKENIPQIQQQQQQQLGPLLDLTAIAAGKKGEDGCGESVDGEERTAATAVHVSVCLANAKGNSMRPGWG